MATHNVDVSQVLHDCRTAFLRDIPADGVTMVSIGANGRWYFEWIHASSGTPNRHIGVEYYMEKPDGLPANVDWVSNTAGNMPDVPTGMADILFSGQNIEHLWQDEVFGFVAEAHRVLKPGGVIALDSPNREITEALTIIHPEHMVEFTPQEMEDILSCAGFDILRKRGIYLCRDPRSGDFLPYEPHNLWSGSWSLIERCAIADGHPNDSYIWWIEARKSGRTPDWTRVRQLIAACWERGWPERMFRLQRAIGTELVESDGTWFQSSPGEQGAVLYGPFSPIKRGRYRAAMLVSSPDSMSDDGAIGIMDVVLNEVSIAQVELFAADLAGGATREFWIMFDVDQETAFGFQGRIISNGARTLRAKKHLDLQLI